jgi:hypothetical protein
MPLHISVLHGQIHLLAPRLATYVSCSRYLRWRARLRLVLGLLVLHETKASVDPWSVSWLLRLPADMHPCRHSQPSLDATCNLQRVVGSLRQPGRLNRSAV